MAHTFFPLELAALERIAAAFPGDLRPQIDAAAVTSRRNSGAGFFTEFSVDRSRAGPIEGPRYSPSVEAVLDGFKGPMGLMAWFEDGYLATLEAYTLGGDDTSQVDFARVNFRLEP
jgi:hypothetical protein